MGEDSLLRKSAEILSQNKQTRKIKMRITTRISLIFADKFYFLSKYWGIHRDHRILGVGMDLRGSSSPTPC